MISAAVEDALPVHRAHRTGLGTEEARKALWDAVRVDEFYDAERYAAHLDDYYRLT
jgi:hypothetical protein